MIMSSLNVEMVKRILVFGFQGKVGAIGTYDEILQIDAARPTGTYPNMSDLVESAFFSFHRNTNKEMYNPKSTTTSMLSKL